MTQAAVKLLRRIGETEDGALRLSKSNDKAAEELKNEGLVVYIRISTGGADVCLTQAGLDAYDRLHPTSSTEV